MTGLAPSNAHDVLRVLVVEDSAPDAELLAAMLEIELPTATVTVARSLAEAHRLLTPEIDAVITDLSLPDAEGLRAPAALRAATASAAVLVMTGRSERATGLAAMAAGADDYLVKGAHDSRAIATAVLYAVQRRRLERHTRRLEGLALSLLEAMEAPTCAVDAQGTIVAVNRAWNDFAPSLAADNVPVGVGDSYFAVSDRTRFADPSSQVAVRTGLLRLLHGQAERFQWDYAVPMADEQRWFSLRVNRLPETEGAVLTHVDVTAAKRTEQELAHQTLHDPLTNLPNRTLLNDRLTQALAWAARRELEVGVAFLDLDQFKRVNDSLGHHAGDALLVAAADRLRSRLRADDTLARFAGDEFVVVWPGLAHAGEAESLAARLRAAFDEPFVLDGTTITVSSSVGIAVGAAPQTADELLLAADMAMYDAKGRGRGRTGVYTRELRESAESRLRIEAELRDALVRKEFVLDFQPVVDLHLGIVRGVEALVRWEHPEGRRMPDSFIPVAEYSGLIVPLGAWVLQEACRQGAAWSANGLELDIAVNLSMRQISHPDLLPTIREALRASGLSAQRLLLEVTESAMLEDAEAAQVVLAQMADLGVQLAIDDFGTGYSSLLYLKRYPIGALKIDRSFVAGMGSNPDDDAIVTSVVSLARAVGSVCIAEGVETDAQHQALRALGCDYAQGYLFGRPVPGSLIPDAVRDCERRLAQPSAPSGRGDVEVTPGVDATVLDRIQDLHAAGASLHTIAAALNREGAPSPHALRWHSAAVAQVIAGTYRPARRRPSFPSLPRQRGASRHAIDVFNDGHVLSARLADRLQLALASHEAVLIVATPQRRALLAAALTGRGVDIAALTEEGRYLACDAQAVLSRISVDGYLSARLFRDVVPPCIESAVDRFGHVHVYAEMVSLLWEQGLVTSALDLEALWDQLAARLPVSLVCGYPRSALDVHGTDHEHRTVLSTHGELE